MKKSFLANTLVIFQPNYFGYNHQTAKTNSFMNKINTIPDKQITTQAMDEFKGVVKSLESAEIDACVLES